MKGVAGVASAVSPGNTEVPSATPWIGSEEMTIAMLGRLSPSWSGACSSRVRDMKVILAIFMALAVAKNGETYVGGVNHHDGQNREVRWHGCPEGHRVEHIGRKVLREHVPGIYDNFSGQ